MTRIPKNGPLSPWHLSILRAIQELQPCGSTEIVKRLSDQRVNYGTIFHTLYRRGLIESDVVRVPGRSPRRKHGTIRLTAAGERAIGCAEVAPEGSSGGVVVRQWQL